MVRSQRSPQAIGGRPRYRCWRKDPKHTDYDPVFPLSDHNSARAYEMICDDTNLGLQRSENLVFIQVFPQGCDAGTKQILYAHLAENLKEECDMVGSLREEC
jgi:hypothetical protein